MLTFNSVLKGLKRSRFIRQDSCPMSSAFASFHTTVSPKMNDTESVKQLYPNGVFNKIACIGTGTMAQAFIEPMVAGNVQPPEKFTVFDVNVATMKQVAQSYKGVATAESIHECVRGADLVICAVKPQNLTSSFFAETKKGAQACCVLLSVVAGKRLETFYEGGFTKIVRSMPNTPATIGQGMTVWSATDNLTVEEREKIRIVLNSCGKSVSAGLSGLLVTSTRRLTLL
jgi:pyrroline-5-carboxylate reductase